MEKVAEKTGVGKNGRPKILAQKKLIQLSLLILNILVITWRKEPWIFFPV